MISLINGHVQNAQSANITPLGYLELTLNVDATVIASPFGQVMAGIPVKIYFDASCNVITTGGVNQIWSNLELNPQQSPSLLGTWYTVNFYDANNCRVNQNPLTWIFPNTAGSTVDIGGMVATNVPGIVYYPVLGAGGGLSGAGTTNTIPIWTSSSALGNSDITYTTSPNTYSTLSSLSLGGAHPITSGFTQQTINGGFTLAGAAGGITGLSLQSLDGSSTGSLTTLTGISSVIGFGTASSETSVGTVAGYSLIVKGALVTGTVTNVYGLNISVDSGAGNGQSGIITNRYGISVGSLWTGTGGTVTNDYSLYVAAPTPASATVFTNHYGLYIADQTNGGGTRNPNPFGIFVAGSAPNQLGGPLTVQDKIQTTATAFVNLPAASGPLEGSMRAVTDSTTNIWGATITGGGANHVLAYCNGTNWTVMAK